LACDEKARINADRFINGGRQSPLLKTARSLQVPLLGTGFVNSCEIRFRLPKWRTT